MAAWPEVAKADERRAGSLPEGAVAPEVLPQPTGAAGFGAVGCEELPHPEDDGAGVGAGAGAVLLQPELFGVDGLLLQPEDLGVEVELLHPELFGVEELLQPELRDEVRPPLENEEPLFLARAEPAPRSTSTSTSASTRQGPRRMPSASFPDRAISRP